MFDIYFPDPIHQTVEEADGSKANEESLVFDFDLDFTKAPADDYPVVVRKFPNGCTCKKCGEVYPYAEPNQIDGSMICYSCRNYG